MPVSNGRKGRGNLKENGGLGQINGIGIAPINRDTDDERNFQNTRSARWWHPLKQASIDAGLLLQAEQI